MSTSTPPPAALIERNMDLAYALLMDQFDHPDQVADIPEGATVVLLPADDPELARFNEEVGLQALRAGQDVYFRHVPAPAAA